MKGQICKVVWTLMVLMRFCSVLRARGRGRGRVATTYNNGLVPLCRLSMIIEFCTANGALARLLLLRQP